MKNFHTTGYEMTTSPILARRKTYDGIRVEMHSDGCITCGLGLALTGVPIIRPRTAAAVNKAIEVGWLFIGAVESYTYEECGLLYKACQKAADKDGLPGTVRRIYAERSVRHG